MYIFLGKCQQILFLKKRENKIFGHNELCAKHFYKIYSISYSNKATTKIFSWKFHAVLMKSVFKSALQIQHRKEIKEI